MGVACLCSKKMASSGVEIDKTLLAFLNGLSRRQYFGEDQFSDEFLREEILGNIDEESKTIFSSLFITHDNSL